MLLIEKFLREFGEGPDTPGGGAMGGSPGVVRTHLISIPAEAKRYPPTAVDAKHSHLGGHVQLRRIRTTAPSEDEKRSH